jgi:hypothetical protein
LTIIEVRIMNGYDFTAYFAGKTAQRAYPLFMRASITSDVGAVTRLMVL